MDRIGERGEIISGVCAECAISRQREETCSNVDWAEIRAVYSSRARNVWVERDRLIVVIVGWMAYMMADIGGPMTPGKSEGGGLLGKRDVISRVSA
jgi:hypothetical protein